MSGCSSESAWATVSLRWSVLLRTMGGGRGRGGYNTPVELNYIEMTGGKGRGLTAMRENRKVCVLGLGKMHSASKVRTF